MTTRSDVDASDSVYPVNYPGFVELVEPGTLLQVRLRAYPRLKNEWR